MRFHTGWLMAGLLMWGVGVPLREGFCAEEPSPAKPSSPEATEVAEPRWMEAMPVPADPELEDQIVEVQKALKAIYQQMVRRKEALKKTQDPAAKATLFDEFERLRKEREDLEKLLHDLVDEAKLSEQTEIDAALARARWLERQQEYEQQKEEIIRDRQQ